MSRNFSKTSRFSDFAEFTENMQVHAVAWSEMLRRLTMTHPDCPVTVWCNEDTPLIWGGASAGHRGRRHGGSARGQGRAGRADHGPPPASGGCRNTCARNRRRPEAQRRRVVSAFLGRYAVEDRFEETVSLPGWTEAFMDELSEAYDADMAMVAEIPGVTFLTP